MPRRRVPTITRTFRLVLQSVNRHLEYKDFASGKLALIFNYRMSLTPRRHNKPKKAITADDERDIARGTVRQSIRNELGLALSRYWTNLDDSSRPTPFEASTPTYGILRSTDLKGSSNALFTTLCATLCGMFPFVPRSILRPSVRTLLGSKCCGVAARPILQRRMTHGLLNRVLVDKFSESAPTRLGR